MRAAVKGWQQRQAWAGRATHDSSPCRCAWAVTVPRATCRRVPVGLRQAGTNAAAENELLARAKSAADADPKFVERLISELQPEARKTVLAVLGIPSAARAAVTTVSAAEEATATAVPTVSRQQLKAVALFIGIPMVGFGFMDNVIMLIAGQSCEFFRGVYLRPTRIEPYVP